MAWRGTELCLIQATERQHEYDGPEHMPLVAGCECLRHAGLSQGPSASTSHTHGGGATNGTVQPELRAFDARSPTASAADLHRFDTKRPAEARTHHLLFAMWDAVHICAGCFAECGCKDYDRI